MSRVAHLLDTANFGQRFLQDLAGNMFSLPVLLAIMMGACAALDWAGPNNLTSVDGPAATGDELAAALELFEVVMRPSEVVVGPA